MHLEVIRDRLDPPVTANQHFGADRRHGHLLREQLIDGGGEVEGCAIIAVAT
jgi:hypothetical protein